MSKVLKFGVFLSVVAVIAVLGLSGCKKNGAVYVTAKVKKGDIVQKITASGTINPISTVNIGTQVSGIIDEIMKDKG